MREAGPKDAKGNFITQAVPRPPGMPPMMPPGSSSHRNGDEWPPRQSGPKDAPGQFIQQIGPRPPGMPPMMPPSSQPRGAASSSGKLEPVSAKLEPVSAASKRHARQLALEAEKPGCTSPAHLRRVGSRKARDEHHDKVVQETVDRCMQSDEDLAAPVARATSLPLRTASSTPAAVVATKGAVSPLFQTMPNSIMEVSDTEPDEDCFF